MSQEKVCRKCGESKPLSEYQRWALVCDLCVADRERHTDRQQRLLEALCLNDRQLVRKRQRGRSISSLTGQHGSEDSIRSKLHRFAAQGIDVDPGEVQAEEKQESGKRARIRRPGGRTMVR